MGILKLKNNYIGGKLYMRQKRKIKKINQKIQAAAETVIDKLKLEII